ncbi:hypothetical protein CAOG_03478 [Capsaspora owczarzaki ATCC 30864]|uniref:Solute carrier family 66 member 2 n=1 Tax=Capsaspora owczarzaki (strain ATCC 30864) TaxID=595528 RepID=A0A0D2WPF2_CAPO3|nr:hypothetical protein CAOG_03478 [Capsaspora owczarzaki ATCC 30864]KJE92528.1 hypothetical protein CAOG_003478 [Capsaspora owczarzaki ATCC 30864]|eukprot:XP_004348383.1 hypothetical protein CAOG_03478 [Capsaspora owczarzaki ATCC 30864]
MVDLGDFVGFIAAAFMIFGGVLPYVPQYLAIKQTRNASGFSTFVSLILILANIVRLYFWLGKRFEMALVYQSVVMLVAQLMMLELCVSMRSSSSSSLAFDDLATGSNGSGVAALGASLSSSALSSARRSNANKSPFAIAHLFDPATFWQWSNFQDYTMFLVVFTAALGVVSVMLIQQNWFVELLGVASVALEASLAIPQFLKNWRTKSTAGMSNAMVLGWLAGDVFKTIYFVTRHSPLQFICCGIVQVLVDLAILAQVFLYPSNKSLS